jgi:hypothetical protein
MRWCPSCGQTFSSSGDLEGWPISGLLFGSPIESFTAVRPTQCEACIMQSRQQREARTDLHAASAYSFDRTSQIQGSF